MRTKSTAGIVASIALVVGLCACSLFEGETGVDYSGIHDSEVQACAAISMGGALRDDGRTPSSIWVRNVDAALAHSSADYHELEYEISGETHVAVGGESRIYAWVCKVAVDFDTRELNARLTSFALN